MFKNKQKKLGKRSPNRKAPPPPYGKFHNFLFLFFEPFPETLITCIRQWGVPAIGDWKYTRFAWCCTSKCCGARKCFVQCSRMGEEVKLLIQSPSVILDRLNKLVNVNILLRFIKKQSFKRIFFPVFPRINSRRRTSYFDLNSWPHAPFNPKYATI